jgi:hypothetical protein
MQAMWRSSATFPFGAAGPALSLGQALCRSESMPVHSGCSTRPISHILFNYALSSNFCSTLLSL